MKKYVSKKKTVILTLACTAAIGGSSIFGSTAHAEEMQAFSLDTMVVTASRVETSKADTPANITVISQEKLEESNYADAAEALADVPGVNILSSGAKGSNMGQDVIMLNGDKRVLVLIDGRRVDVASSGNYSADWLPPVNAIEKIEVLKGAGSALYGTDAVGGVINVITKKGSKIGDKVTVKAATGSWGTEQYGVSASGNNDGVGIFVSANKEKRGNYSYKNNKTGAITEMNNSGYDDTGATIKLDKAIGDNDRVTLQAEHFLTEGGAPFSGRLSDAYQRLNNNVALRYDWNENKDNAGFAQIYKNYHHSYFYSTKYPSDFTENKHGVEVQQNWKLDEKNSLTGGIEYYKAEVDNVSLYSGSYAYNKSIDNKAAYLEERWQFGGSWQLNSGVRYDEHSRYGSEMTPHFALNKKISEDSNAYISWGKVFNAPTTDQLYKYVAGMGKPNPDLKPETGDVLTIGVNKKISEKTNFSASIFSSKLNDAIGWKDLNPTDADTEKTAINISSEKRRGLEISADHRFDDNWSMDASYTYLQVKSDYADGYGYLNDGSAKPNVYRAGVKFKKDKLLVDLTMKAATGQAYTYIGKGGTTKRAYTDNSYFTLDLGAQYKLNDKAKIFLQLNNLNNAAYQEISGWNSTSGFATYPMASRNFVVGMEYNF